MTTNLPSLLIAIPEGVIDLGWGHPSARLHPTETLAEAARQALGYGAAEPLQYGAIQGYGPFLETLAGFLSEQPAYGGRVAAGSLFVTAGASQGIDLAATLLARAGDTVLVEEPTYYLIGDIFRDHGLRVVGAPTDGDGLDTEALAGMLAEGSCPAPRLVYCIPTYQNPSGAVLPMERRRQLLGLARQYGFVVLADEVYQLLHYGAPPPPPLAMLDEGPEGCVISLGSFSKILAPGLRLGWAQAAPGLISRLTSGGLPVSGGGLNHFAATLAHATLKSGWLQENVEHLRGVYGRRMTTATRALDRMLGDRAEFTAPQGGYFIWLRLKGGVDTEGMLAAAQESGVAYRPGPAFSTMGGLRDALRISISLYEEEELTEGVRRLAEVAGSVRWEGEGGERTGGVES